MGFVALGLFILACGWNFYREYLPTRTNAIRAEGHPQYFGATLSAGFLFLLACCLHTAALHSDRYREVLTVISALSPRADDARPKGEDKQVGATSINVAVPVLGGKGTAKGSPDSPSPTVAPSPLTKLQSARLDDFIEMVGAAIWCSLLSVVLPQLLNLPFSLNRLLTLRSMYPVLEDVERFAVDATQRELAVAYTLQNGKVYVGVPKPGGPDNSSNVQWINIAPLASGKRNSNGTLNFTTAYTSVYEELESDLNELRGRDDFRIGIPVSQIITMQYFDLDLYTRRFEALAITDPDLSTLLAEALKDEEAEELEGQAESGQVTRSSLPPSATLGAAESAAVSTAEKPASGFDITDITLMVAQWSATVSMIAAILVAPLSWYLTMTYLLFATIALLVLALLPSGSLRSRVLGASFS